jgi:threonine dehydrogenase-like Zn-dependent dehydrogenase
MRFPTEPGGLGHEGWGTVDAVGADVSNLQVGDPVAALSQHAYAEYDVADANDVIKLPGALAGQPFPGEPLGCAVNIFRRAEVQAGQTVAIVGIGFLGALLIQLAVHAGARVLAVAHRPFAQQVARDMGADVVIPMDDHYRIIEQVKELTEGAFCPVVIECTGKQWPLDLSAELCAVRGRLVIAGYHQDGPRQINLQLWNWRGLDVINAHERDPEIYREGIRAAVAAVESGAMDPRALYTHRFPLDGLGDALNQTAERPDGFLKALVLYE